MKKILLTILAYICICQHTQALYSLSNQESLNNQLSNNAILCMYQDHYGFMWFGTYDGLNLYDGKTVKTFRFELGNPGSLSGNSIHNILQADEGHLWISTQVGLDKFSLKDRRVTESYTDYKKVSLIVADDNGDMWLIHKNNVLSYYNSNQSEFHELELKGTNIQDVKAMFRDPDGRLCLAKGDGKIQHIELLCKENEVQPSLPYSVSIKEHIFHDKTVESVFYEDARIYFIDEEHNLFVYDEAKDQKMLLRNIADIVNKYGTISSLCFFQHNIFLAFMYSGLIKLNMLDNITSEPINMTIGIFGLMKDRNQNAMWVATDGRGVELYCDEKDTFGNILLEHLPFTARRPVRALYTDEENTLWIGTKGDGIIRIKDYDQFNNRPIPRANVETMVIYKEQNKEPVYRFVRSQYNKNDLWIAGGLLSCYSYKDNHIYPIQTPDNQDNTLSKVHTLCEVNDSTLWVASEGLYEVVIDKQTHPYRIKSNTKRPIMKDGEEIEDDFYSMLYDGDSILTLGSRKGYGAIHYNIHTQNSRFVLMDNAENKGLGDVICVYTGKDSALYIGASSGMTRIKMNGAHDNEIKQFGRKDGIINDMIHGILEDNKGIIWLSTNKGLVKYNPSNGSFFNVKSTKIGVSEFSDDAYWHCPLTGRLMFGGVNGLVWIEPRTDERLPDNEPGLLFTELSTYEKEQTLYEYNEDKTKEIILPASQATFQVSFAVLDYMNGDNYDYSYLLENYDTHWVSLQKENKISFTRLPPGNYVLKVKYANDVVRADEKVYSLPITILPPWYLSKAAYIVYTILLISALLLIAYYIRKRFKEKQRIIAERIRKEQEEQLYEAKMRFFTNVTHELYTPLTLINGALNQIEKADHMEQVGKYAGMLRNNVSGLNELIQEILDYRRIEENNENQYTFSNVSVTEMMNSLLASFADIAIQNKIELHTSIEEDLYWYTDKNSLKKIVSNLLSNAFKYTPGQGAVNVKASIENNSLRISVYNTGRGIEKDRMKSIFNRYQVLEETDVNANNQMTARNGLGLSICYSLARFLQGDITVKSEVDKYAEFIVILPDWSAKDTESRNMEVPKEKEQMKIEDNRTDKKADATNGIDTIAGSFVLVVDDNSEIVELISDILSPQYEVLKAHSVAEAQQLLNNQTPGLIITDIMMPDVDGLSFIQMVREDKYNKHIPIVALSAKVKEPDIIKGYEAGADAYITKPFSPDILLSIVHRFLQNKEEIKDYYDTTESAFEYKSGKLMHQGDREFIEALSEIVRENVNNPDMSPDFIAEKMNISSRRLYRQLKKILSVSFRDFIKDYRLSYAAKLLLTTDLTIKEIIHKTGFSNKSYFYNEFSRKYNVSPKGYKEGGGER